MQLLLSKQPILGGIGCKGTYEYYKEAIECCDQLNIATGFITNDSIAELRHLSSTGKTTCQLTFLSG